MKSTIIALMRDLKRPLMIFDGDCGFCRLWIGRWKAETAGKVDFMPSQEAAPLFPSIPEKDFAAAVQLVEPDGRRFQGAEAVFRSLSYAPGKGRWLAAYRRVPGFAAVSEAAYRFVAARRPAFSRLTRLLWGPDASAPRWFLSRWLFLRLLGAVYLVAFLSFSHQQAGLIGSKGIAPAAPFLAMVHQRLGASAYRLVPTLAWLDASDRALALLSAAGSALSVLLILGVAPVPVLIGLWALYLSLTSIGADFLSFQWDNLLLETGFLAIFLAPRRLLPRLSKETPPSGLAVGLFHWLLFRLMFESGCVKLLSGDPAWRELAALDYHYWTQPLPTWVGWWAAQLPAYIQHLSTLIMFVIELGAPWLIFLPRRPRLLGAAALASLQVLIALTGNYCFFNALTLGLCLLLVDDASWEALVPALRKLKRPSGAAPGPLKGRLLAAAAAVIVLTTGGELAGLLLGRGTLPGPLAGAIAAVEPFRSTNGYGLFAVMTTKRVEIVVEGSDDGRVWRDYGFKWKPGPLERRPAFVAPYQPRLDWQMWFAALGTYDQNPWFLNFLVRLMQGSPDVLALLETNPFPDHPPKFVRSLAYEYSFTTPSERRATGEWWKRVLAGLYSPPMGLRPDDKQP